MKLHRKIFAVLAVALLGAGCGDFWSPGIRVYDVQTYELSGDFTNRIALELETSEVMFVNTDSSNLQVILSNYVDAGGYSVGMDYIENHLICELVTNTAGTLVVQLNSDLQPDFWNIYGFGSRVVVKVPKNISIKTQEVTGTTGGIVVKNNNPIGYLKISATTGGVVVQNSAASNMTVNITTGGIKVSDSQCTAISLNATSGGIDLNDITAGTIDVDTTTGGVDGYNIVCNKLTVETTSGGIDFDGENGIKSPDVTLIAGSGGIDIKAANVDKMNVSATTGGIDAEILSFLDNTSAVDMDVTTGAIDLEVERDATANLKVTAATTLGGVDVDIDFANETVKTGNNYSGYNGTGGNVVNLTATTGGIDVDYN